MGTSAAHGGVVARPVKMSLSIKMAGLRHLSSDNA